MAILGGIWLDGNGKRSIDSTGKTILDNACGYCCCSPSGYKVVVAGTTICACPVPNFNGGGIGGIAVCNNSSFLQPVPPDDLLCAFTFGGSLNGTWFLPQVSNNPGVPNCGYGLVVNPPPITIFLNTVVAGKFVCGPPFTRQLVVTNFTIGLFFFGSGVVQSLQFSMGCTVNVPECGGNVSFTFASGILGGGERQICDTLCPLNVIPLLTPCQWAGGLSSLVVHPGQGGTATITHT